MSRRRPEILPEVVPTYESGSRHPDQLRVSFSDGSTATYRLEMRQPPPQLMECIDIIRNPAYKIGYWGNREYEED